MSRKENYSRLKYQEKFTHKINRLLRNDFRDLRLQFVTVTHVELSSDYSLAKVYWDTFDSKAREKIEEILNSIATKMRTHIAKESSLRHTPQLEFIYNSQYEDEKHIESLLHQRNPADLD